LTALTRKYRAQSLTLNPWESMSYKLKNQIYPTRSVFNNQVNQHTSYECGSATRMFFDAFKSYLISDIELIESLRVKSQIYLTLSVLNTLLTNVNLSRKASLMSGGISEY
jgi:hypothetical protein